MSQLFDLLQGQIECWDGVRDHTLMEGGKTWIVIQNKKVCIRFSGVMCCRVFPVCTSGGVFVGGVTSEALDEAFDGEGLTDTLESLSASLVPLPFTWEHKHSSSASSILIRNTDI